MNVLFVCTANVARSPMAERVFRELSGGQTAHAVRSAGTHGAAARRVTTRDLEWADVVAVMEAEHLAVIQRWWPSHVRKVRVMEVADDFDPDEPELRRILTEKVRALIRDVSEQGGV